MNGAASSSTIGNHMNTAKERLVPKDSLEDSGFGNGSVLRSLSMEVGDDGTMGSERAGNNVWLHIYHCDQFTGFLNSAWLKEVDAPIYHAGVEVDGDEWSFQYFEDSWDDPSISGIIRCRPKQMMEFEYQESVCLGPTPLGYLEVEQLLTSLYAQWPACSYHLTRRNCLTFAETLCEQLHVAHAYPQMLRGIGEAAKNNPNSDAIVDYVWSWAKWYMMKKHEKPVEPPPNRDDSGWFSMPFLGSDWACGQCTGTLCSPSKLASSDDCIQDKDASRNARAYQGDIHSQS